MQYKREFFGTLGIGLTLLGVYVGYNAWSRHAERTKLAADAAKIQAVAGDTPKPDLQAFQNVFNMVRSGEVSQEAAFDFMRRQMESRVQTYFSLPEGPQRIKFLDDALDQMQAIERIRGATTRPDRERTTTGPSERGGNPNSGSDGGNRAQNRGESWRRWIDSMPPARRAQFSEFRVAMAERAKARGIDLRGWGGGGRGPGSGGGAAGDR